MKFIIPLIVSVFILLSCGSSKSDKKINHFIVEKATYQNWYGGLKGVRGINIEITGKSISEKAIYQTVFFANKSTKINTAISGNRTILKANINTSTRQNIILSSDRNQEFKNKPPTKPKYPNLSKNEAVIEYTLNGKLNTFKVNLTKKEDLFYP
jgi:hypothetical protein